jgi:photosystem II stability/assembly factor-like uncharacterized protein
MTFTDITWGKFYISGKPDGSTIIITGFIASGMMVSKNQGVTWTAVSGLPDTTLIAPALWTGTRWLFGRLSICAMDDNQQNITTVLASTGGNLFDLKQNPNTKTILAFGGQGSTNYIWRSIDDGTTWTRTGYGIMKDYMRGGSYSPSLNIWVGFGYYGTCYSTDDGLTWSAYHALEGIQTEHVNWIPSDGLFVLSQNDSGYRTSTDGINWSTNLPTGVTAFWNIQKVFSKYFSKIYLNGMTSLAVASNLTGPWTAINTGYTLQRSQGFFITPPPS